MLNIRVSKVYNHPPYLSVQRSCFGKLLRKIENYNFKTHYYFGVKQCVPLTRSYHVYFLRNSKVSSMLHHGSLVRVHNKEYYFKFTYIFLVFFVFYQKKLCSNHFHLFF